MKVMGIDPGGTTGWCIQQDNERLGWGHVKFPDLPVFITSPHDWSGIDCVVIEDFMLLGGKAIAQVGSRFDTVQAIGMFKLWAHHLHIPVVLQPPAIKPLASKYSGIKVPSNHTMSHRVDAQLHAIYYLRKHNHYKTKLEREGLSDDD